MSSYGDYIRGYNGLAYDGLTNTVPRGQLATITHPRCPSCGKEMMQTNYIGTWCNMFVRYIHFAKNAPRKQRVIHKTDVTPRSFAYGIRYIMEKCYTDDPEKIKDIVSSGKVIIKDLMLIDPQKYDIDVDRVMWKVVLTLLQIWYILSEFVTIGEVIHYYGIHSAVSWGNIDNPPLGSRYGEEEMRDFYTDLCHDIPKIVTEKAMWELWYENDPATSPDGVGNCTIWLPREMVEDVMSFGCIRIGKKKPDPVVPKFEYGNMPNAIAQAFHGLTHE